MGNGSETGLMSMTGFATASGSFKDWDWVTDIRAVNGRGLDLRLRVPDWIEGLEPEARKLCQARLARGNVTLGVRIQRAAETTALSLNDTVLAAALDALARIEKSAENAGLTVHSPTTVEIAQMRGVMDANETSETENIAGLRSAVLASVDQALTGFQENRASEGAALAVVLGEQLDRIEALTKDASAALGDREAAARTALERALGRLLDASEMPDEARLLQELALIAVKNDVTEEIDRLNTHIAAARSLMKEGGPKGRKFDFLMQEFNREANTLCSKSQSAALTAIGLDLKAVIDQMREQVQNVE